MKSKPIIGITLDWEDTKTYSKYSPWYALRENYITAIIKSGGTPLLIPYDLSSIMTYVKIIDGLVIPGGDYDLSPKDYNEDKRDVTRIQKENRVIFETSLLQAAMDKKIPILGICAGHQLIAVKIGQGTLIQDIATDFSTEIEHEQSKNDIPPAKPSHNITIEEKSLLYKITKTKIMHVNSSHHQAIKTISDDFMVSAISPDGIIEAIEHKTYPFLMGVEWHPEYEVTPHDKMIFDALIEYANLKI